LGEIDMKKVVVILLMVFFSANLFAEVHGDYVKTENGTFFFKKVKQGIKCCLVGITENGEKVKFTKPEIVSFCKDGQVYEKMPLYNDNKPTDKQEFMALVCYRHGMKLYKYENMNNSSMDQFRRYFIFKGDKYVLEVTEKNRPTLISFFNSK
jgi:hypothetical protein